MIYRIAGNLTDWSSFVAAIDQADEYWGAQWNSEDPVTGETNSWLNTTTLGRAVMHRGDWSELSREDYYLMLGRDGYGLLGSFGAARLANNVFRNATEDNLSTRRRIRQALQPVINASNRVSLRVHCRVRWNTWIWRGRGYRDSLPDFGAPRSRNLCQQWFTSAAISANPLASK